MNAVGYQVYFLKTLCIGALAVETKTQPFLKMSRIVKNVSYTLLVQQEGDIKLQKKSIQKC